MLWPGLTARYRALDTMRHLNVNITIGRVATASLRLGIAGCRDGTLAVIN
jgi:hypothetical protein